MQRSTARWELRADAKWQSGGAQVRIAVIGNKSDAAVIAPAGN